MATSGEIPWPPAVRTRWPLTRASGDIQVFSPEEVWAVIRSVTSEQDGALYLTAAFTGAEAGGPTGAAWTGRHCVAGIRPH